MTHEQLPNWCEGNCNNLSGKSPSVCELCFKCVMCVEAALLPPSKLSAFSAPTEASCLLLPSRIIMQLPENLKTKKQTNTKQKNTEN